MNSCPQPPTGGLESCIGARDDVYEVLGTVHTDRLSKVVHVLPQLDPSINHPWVRW